MYPARTKLAIAAATLLFWVMLVSVAVQDYLGDGGRDLWEPLLWESSSVISLIVLLSVQRYFTRRHDHLIATPWRWFAAQVLWLPLQWLAFVPMAFGMRHAVYALAGRVYEHLPWPQLFVYESIKLTLFYSMFMVMLFGVLSYHAMHEEKLNAERSTALLRQGQLMRLTQQMQPHFLFNALNTISSLMHSNVERADATLIQLAAVLRATLDLSERHDTPLANELQLVRGYAGVMTERYADRVAIAWHIDEDALACTVPVMSIQPLLENIFKHTVERNRHTTRIAICAALEGGQLVVRLADDRGVLDAAGSAGIGLRNLRERLAVMYGGAASITLAQLAPAGVSAEMRLPCAC